MILALWIIPFLLFNLGPQIAIFEAEGALWSFCAQKEFCRAQKIEFIWGLKNAYFSKPKALQELPQIYHQFVQKCKFLHFYLLPLPNYFHFWDRRSALITFGHTNNFVGNKKLNLYGVLKIHFFQNQRRYKSCSKMATKCHKFPKSHTKNTRKMWFGHNLVVYGPIP